MPTGLSGLDELLGGGLQARRLAVLLGGPGTGKTALAAQVAEHIADSGRPVLFLTLEDAPDVMLARALARLGDLDYGAVLQGRRGLHDRIDATLREIAERRWGAAPPDRGGGGGSG